MAPVSGACVMGVSISAIAAIAVGAADSDAKLLRLAPTMSASEPNHVANSAAAGLCMGLF